MRCNGTAYIKVHASEIADDYPEPAPYEVAEEEVDEVLLFGEQEDYGAAAPDAEWLPRKTLSDFSIYNAEVDLFHSRPLVFCPASSTGPIC